MRSVSGGRPAMHTTQASHTFVLSGHRTRFWPTKLLPSQDSTSTPRVAAPAQTQHRNAGIATHCALTGTPMRAWIRWVGGVSTASRLPHGLRPLRNEDIRQGHAAGHGELLHLPEGAGFDELDPLHRDAE